MTRDDFDRILVEEGIDDARLRDNIWHLRLPGELDENEIRTAAKMLKNLLSSLLAKQALN